MLVKKVISSKKQTGHYLGNYHGISGHFVMYYYYEEKAKKKKKKLYGQDCGLTEQGQQGLSAAEEAVSNFISMRWTWDDLQLCKNGLWKILKHNNRFYVFYHFPTRLFLLLLRLSTSLKTFLKNNVLATTSGLEGKCLKTLKPRQ